MYVTSTIQNIYQAFSNNTRVVGHTAARAAWVFDWICVSVTSVTESVFALVRMARSCTQKFLPSPQQEFALSQFPNVHLSAFILCNADTHIECAAAQEN